MDLYFALQHAKLEEENVLFEKANSEAISTFIHYFQFFFFFYCYA